MINTILINAPHYSEGWKYFSKSWEKRNASSETNFKAKFLLTCRKALIVLAGVIYAIATPLLALIDVTFTFASSFKDRIFDGNCHLFFKTDLFEDYHSQIIQIVNKHLEGENSEKYQKLNALVSQESVGTSVKLRRKWYCSFSHALRSLKNESDELCDTDRELIKELYLNVQLIDKLGDIFSQIHKSDEISNMDDIWNDLSREYKNEGNTPKAFDAHSFGNVPFTLGSISIEGREIQITRMPSVTKDLRRNLLGKTQEVMIVEEFDMFLNALKNSNGEPKRHLYVNLMARKFGNERIRSNKIEALNVDSEKLISVLTLDKNSGFYKQTGKKYKVKNIQKVKFIKDFLHKLTKKDGYFYIPEEIGEANLESIIQEVSEMKLFNNLNQLSRSERGLFIEHVYVRLIVTAAKVVKASSLNISCLSCIDRGAAQNYMVFKHLEENSVVNPLTERQMKTLLFTPALMVGNRPIKRFYFKRACSFAKESA